MSAHGLNFGNMKSQIQRIVMDVYDRRVDDMLIGQWIRQGHIETDGYVKWSRDCQEITALEDTDVYALDEWRRQIVFVTFGSTDVEVNSTSIEEMHRMRNASSDAIGTPDYFAVWAGDIYLYPYPTEDEIIYVWHCVIPEEMACDQEYPSLPAELHQSVVDYALHRAYLHLEDPAHASTYRNTWQAALDRWTPDVADYSSEQASIIDVEPF